MWVRSFLFLCGGLLACASWLPLGDRAIYSRTDVQNFCLSELELHLHGNHASGPALWDPHVQLGRPAIHAGGLSQAYWLCRLLSWFLDDAWTLYTALVLATLVLGGIFAWLLFLELRLHPLASAACALGFAFASFHGQTGLYLCFASGSAWTMGIAWSVMRLLREASFANGLLLALATHSALLSSYPQQLVWWGWILICLLLGSPPPAGLRLRPALALVGWAAAGALSAGPFLLDLLAQARLSSRLEIDDSRFLLPALGGVRGALLRLRELGDPLWSGRQRFDFLFMGGASFTPFFGAMLLAALTAGRKRLTRWLAGFVLCTVVLTLSNPLFILGVRYLGLWLSPFIPFAAATVPVYLLAAIGLDHCLRVPGRTPRLLAALVLPGLLVAGALASGRTLDAWNVSLSLALALAGGLTLFRPLWPLVAVASLVTAAHYGVGSMPVEPRAEIARIIERVEPLAGELRRRTEGARFAWVKERRPVFLGPNSEQLYGLHSIHSFDALTPRRYRAWARRICAPGTKIPLRIFDHVVGEQGLGSEDFARSGVRVVLAERPLASPHLRLAARHRRLFLYEVIARGPLVAWLPRASCTLAPTGVRVPGELARNAVRVERLPGPDERVLLVLEPRDEPGLLWLSQQYHSDWRARSGEERLETVMVDGIWQGILVPAGAARVELEFRPWIRWWWVPQILFLLGGAIALLRLRSPRGPR